MNAFGRVVFFLVCLWFSLVPIAHVSAYLWSIEPESHQRMVGRFWLFFTWLAASTSISAVVCFPIAWVYGRAAPWVALSLTLPFVGVRFHELRPNAGDLELAVYWWSVLSYVVFITGATILARRFILRRRVDGGSGTQPIV